MKRTLLSQCIGLLIFRAAIAQSELTLPTLSHLLESDRYNPAISKHDEGFYIGGPGAGFDAFHTGPGYQDFIEIKGGKPFLKISQLAEELTGDNEFVSAFRLQTLKALWRKGKWSFGLEHEIVYQGHVTYPDALIRLYVEGNQAWIGQSVDIAPLASIVSYNNFTLPVAYHAPKFSLGIRPRLLVGNQLGHTPKSRAELHTDEDFFQLTLTTDYVFQNVGILDFRDANLLNYEIANLRQWTFFSNHVGLGLDLGSRWQVSDRGTLALAVSDIGFIDWQGVKTYVSQNVTSYEGVEVVDLFELGQIDFDQSLDSLNSIFDVETSNDNLRYNLPHRWHAHFTYELNQAWQLSTSFTYQGSLLRPWNVGVVVTGELKTGWHLGATVANRFGELAAGMHSSLAWRSITGFLIMDQVLAGVNPLRANHLQLRAGFNLNL